MTITKPSINKVIGWPLPTNRIDHIPPLHSGDRLTRREFELRYEQMPQKFTAELVEGVVYMTSPVSLIHSEAHSAIIGWLLAYRAVTPGAHLSDNATVRLDVENEVQPDAALWIDPATGGQARIGDKYLEGPPELIFEVALTSASYDLHDKLRVYRRNGVQEYVVWQVYDQKLDWFELKDGEYLPFAPDAEGVIHSKVFPGLRLAVKYLLEGELAAVLAELQKGLASPEHTAFVERLKNSSAS